MTTTNAMPLAAVPATRPVTSYKPGDAFPLKLDGVPVATVQVVDLLPK